MNNIGEENQDKTALEQLIRQWFECQDDTERQQWLDQHRDELALARIEESKTEADALLMQRPKRSLEIAEAALQAASLSSEPLAEAVARWTQGNAWAYLGEYNQALAAYTRAHAIYREHSQEQLALARLQSNMVAMLNNLGRYQEALDMADKARNALQPWAQTHYMATLEMNVGSICRLLGHYDDALAAYERGRAIFDKLQNQTQMARMDINRARVLVCLDRFREAETLLQHASAVLEQEQQALPAARADLNRATLLSRQGRYREALKTYDQARQVFQELGVETDVAVTDLYKTYDLVSLNLLPEAQDIASEARAVLEAHTMPRYVALATGNRAVAARKLGHLADALNGFREARTFFLEQDAEVEVALLDLECAICLREMGQRETAMQVAEQARTTLAGHNLILHLAHAELVLADCAFDANDLEQAQTHYAKALTHLAQMPSLAWWAYDGLGRIDEARGNLEQALARYSQAIDHLETIQHILGIDEFRAGFMDDKLPVYQRAVRVALALMQKEDAFRHIEQSKSGIWRDFVTLETQEHAEQEELKALKQKWHWLYNRLNRPDDEDELRGRNSGDYWTELCGLERQIAQMRRVNSPLLALTPIPSLKAVQSHIPQDAILLDYYCTDQVVLVCIIDSERYAFETLAPLDAIKQLIWRWQFNIEYAYEMLASDSSTQLSPLCDEAREILGALSQHLVIPLRPYLKQRRQVWIAPHDFLWSVPFSALTEISEEEDTAEYLVERYDLTYLSGILVRTEDAERAPGDLFAEPVVVAFSGAGQLSHTLDEGKNVSTILGHAQLFAETDATIDQARAAARSCSLLHLATHGVFRSDAPLFSSVRLSDGWLTAYDLETWQMPNADLVTLSACETGLSQSRGSDLLGLARGFFKAGAKQLVVSQWSVDDASTSKLMVHFYNALRKGHQVAAALRQAQLATMHEYEHPFFWAGFQVLKKPI
ncbi:MAG: CHAT domain-containing protein [Anaerolineae bacterium]|nr:CHAT domain-containing protein [Anaerolineae bacterium]